LPAPSCLPRLAKEANERGVREKASQHQETKRETVDDNSHRHPAFYFALGCSSGNLNFDEHPRGAASVCDTFALKGARVRWHGALEVDVGWQSGELTTRRSGGRSARPAWVQAARLCAPRRQVFTDLTHAIRRCLGLEERHAVAMDRRRLIRSWSRCGLGVRPGRYSPPAASAAATTASPRARCHADGSAGGSAEGQDRRIGRGDRTRGQRQRALVLTDPVVSNRRAKSRRARVVAFPARTSINIPAGSPLPRNHVEQIRDRPYSAEGTKRALPPREGLGIRVLPAACGSPSDLRNLARRPRHHARKHLGLRWTGIYIVDAATSRCVLRCPGPHHPPGAPHHLRSIPRSGKPRHPDIRSPKGPVFPLRPRRHHGGRPTRSDCTNNRRGGAGQVGTPSTRIPRRRT